MRMRVWITTFIMISLLFSASTVSMGFDSNSDEEDGHNSRNPSDSWSMFKGDIQRTGRSEVDTSNNPGMIKWNFRPEPEAWTWASPIIGPDGTIYFGSFNHYLYAIYPNGTLKWKFETLSTIENSPSVSSDNIVYQGAMDGYTYAIYGNNGTLKWKYHTGRVRSSPLLGYNDTLYIGADNGTLYSLTLEGELNWAIDVNCYLSSPAQGHDGEIYIGGYDYYLYSIYPNGSVNWKFKTGEKISSTPAIDENNHIYFTSWDGHLYAVYPNGTEKWKKYFPGTGGFNNFYCSPAIDPEENIICRSASGSPNLYKISNNGTIIWKRTLGWDHSSPTVDRNGMIYISDAKDLVCFYPDKSLNWFGGASIRGSPTIGPNGDVLSTGGGLYVFGSREPYDPILQLDGYGNRNVEISWELNRSDSDPEINEITVYRSEDGTSFEEVANLDGDAIDFNDTDLTNGQEYYYYITSTNEYGESDPSNIVSEMPRTLPDPPINLIGNPGDERANLTWEPPLDDGGSPILTYQLFRKETGEDWEFLENITSDQDSYEDTNLMNGVEYRYYLKSVNSEGISQPSSVISVIPRTVPGKPIFESIAHDSFVKIVWIPPMDNGGSEITGYNIYRGIAADDLTLIAEVEEEITSYNDTDVTNGVTYYYSVSSENIAGESEIPDAMECKPKGPPTSPLDVNIGWGNEFVLIGWEPPENDNGAEITGYVIFRGSSNEIESADIRYDLDASTVEYNDTDVLNGNSYWYWISAVNEVGESSRAGPFKATPVTTPGPPVNLDFLSGSGFILINWSRPDNNGGSPIIGYSVYRQKNMEGFIKLADVSNDILSYNDTEVENGVTYTYYLTAKNEIGISPRSDLINAVPVDLSNPPSPPRNLTHEQGPGFIHIGWTEPEDDGGSPITGYIIYRSVESNSLESLDQVSGDILEYNDTSVVSGKFYQYYVTAVNEKGESLESEGIRVSALKEDGNEEENGGGGILFIIIIVIIVALLLVAGGIFLFFIMRKEKGMEDDRGEDLPSNEDSKNDLYQDGTTIK